jgi:membrane-associated phospholipid phosphatase
MSKLIKQILLLLLVLPIYITPMAQELVEKTDTTKFKQHSPFPWKGMIAPVVMVGYGFAAVKMDVLQQLNRNIQDKVWTNNPHAINHLDDYLRFAPAVAVYGLNLAGVHGKNNFRDRTMIFAMSNLLMGGTVYSLKYLIREPLTEPPHNPGYNSFPSGHAAEAFLCAEFMREEYAQKSAWYGIAGYACAIATGYLRVYNNNHWFSDVIAGAGIGIGSVKFSAWLYPKISRRLFKDKPVNTLILPVYQNNAFGLCMVRKL